LPIKTARFANVAFSNGSLPLGFLDRLAKNQPWSCPLGIRRFFVSPQESGELCLMASIMGETGDIFFPKLDDKRDMIPFDRIALDLLKELGLKPEIYKIEEEARSKTTSECSDCDHNEAELNNLSETSAEPIKSWPIYFFGSDTSGEKSFEEFYTEKEILDNDTFINLGVIKNSKKRSIAEIDNIFDNLENLFKKESVTKTEIVDVLKEYLPNFEHIETGKGLDSKM
jgi:FlaA1/EpsC-like NDP-sugar epimerase